jgi:hypothetical protein
MSVQFLTLMECYVEGIPNSASITKAMAEQASNKVSTIKLPEGPLIIKQKVYKRFLESTFPTQG